MTGQAFFLAFFDFLAFAFFFAFASSAWRFCTSMIASGNWRCSSASRSAAASVSTGLPAFDVAVTRVVVFLIVSDSSKAFVSTRISSPR